MTFSEKAVGLLETEDDSNMIHRNVNKYLPIDKAEDLNIQQHRCENLKLCIIGLQSKRPLRQAVSV
jgi:hypothetical protein